MKTYLFLFTLIAAAVPGYTPVPRDLQPYSGIQRYNITLQAQTVSNGQFTHYQNFAAEPWRNDTPDRDDSQIMLRWPIMADMGGRYPNWVYFWDARFRSMNGVAQKNPIRWAYYRPTEEQFNGQNWVYDDGIPVSTVDLVTYRADALEPAVRFLMKHHPVGRIRDMMDKIEGLTDKGAPE